MESDSNNPFFFFFFSAPPPLATVINPLADRGTIKKLTVVNFFHHRKMYHSIRKCPGYTKISFSVLCYSRSRWRIFILVFPKMFIDNGIVKKNQNLLLSSPFTQFLKKKRQIVSFSYKYNTSALNQTSPTKGGVPDQHPEMFPLNIYENLTPDLCLSRIEIRLWNFFFFYRKQKLTGQRVKCSQFFQCLTVIIYY